MGETGEPDDELATAMNDLESVQTSRTVKAPRRNFVSDDCDEVSGQAVDLSEARPEEGPLR